jgi:cytochrome c oxidase cbb3-type subunit III
MADFVHPFWSWFIIIVTLVSIAGMLWLIVVNTERRKKGAPETMGHVWDEDLEEYNNPLPRWWLNLFYITIAFSLIYLLLFPGLGSFQGLLGWSQQDRFEREAADWEDRFAALYAGYAETDLAELAGNEAAMRTGERLFANYCSTCHGADARGAPGFPNLRDAQWQWGGDPEAIRTSILDGRRGVMPAWGDALGEEGVFQVTEYVLSLSGRRADPAVVAQGRQRYEQMCVACHGADGLGNAAMGAPDLTNNIWVHGGSQRAVMATIINGREGYMPPHRDFLGADRVHLLAAYVYSLRGADPQ